MAAVRRGAGCTGIHGAGSGVVVVIGVDFGRVVVSDDMCQERSLL